MKLYMLEKFPNHFLGVYSGIELVRKAAEDLEEDMHTTYIVTEIELDAPNNSDWPVWITTGEHPLEWKRM